MASKPAFTISAHVFSFGTLLIPCAIYGVYAYRQGVGDDNPTEKLLREKYKSRLENDNKLEVRSKTMEVLKKMHTGDEGANKVLAEVLRGGASTKKNHNRIAFERVVEEAREAVEKGGDGGGGGGGASGKGASGKGASSERDARQKLRRTLTSKTARGVASTAAPAAAAASRKKNRQAKKAAGGSEEDAAAAGGEEGEEEGGGGGGTAVKVAGAVVVGLGVVAAALLGAVKKN